MSQRHSNVFVSEFPNFFLAYSPLFRKNRYLKTLIVLKVVDCSFNILLDKRDSSKTLKPETKLKAKEKKPNHICSEKDSVPAPYPYYWLCIVLVKVKPLTLFCNVNNQGHPSVKIYFQSILTIPE